MKSFCLLNGRKSSYLGMAACLSETQRDFQSDTDSELGDDEPLSENFEFPNSTSCWVCNGYYGPNYGEPLCGACHSFLYPNTSVDQQSTTLDSDDEDSGNDEPPFNVGDKDRQDVVEYFDRSESPYDEALDLEQMNVLIAMKRPPPAPPRSLLEYIEQLSQPRVVEKSEKKITSMPVEILVSIFSYLDDISLLNVSEVCKQWRTILEMSTGAAMWRKYLKQRWPLFKSLIDIPNSFQLYSVLMSSCFCRTCVLQMALKTPPLDEENIIRMNRLRMEQRSFNLDPSEGVDALPLDRNCTHWQASILGPTGSPYEGGKFFLYIFFPDSYPMFPPTVQFLTKILHPNVSRHGDVGIDIIQHNWSVACTVQKLLLSLQSLLTDPFTEVCMEPELGYMYDHNRQRFENLARSWTWKYAMFEAIPPQ